MVFLVNAFFAAGRAFSLFFARRVCGKKGQKGLYFARILL
jgi:hypothetical protein